MHLVVQGFLCVYVYHYIYIYRPFFFGLKHHQELVSRMLLSYQHFVFWLDGYVRG